MSQPDDLMKLYSTRILALASDIAHVGRLDRPDATAVKRAPLCGSKVSVDVQVAGGRLTGFAQDVKACALGQAAASVFGQAALGLGLDDVRGVRDALQAMLTDGGPVPAAPFADYEVLLPARAFANRHASIMLTLEATIDAMEQAMGLPSP